MSGALTLRSPARNPNPDTLGNDGAPDAGQTMPAPNAPVDPQEEMDKEALLRRFIEWFKASRDHNQEWRQEAIDCFDYTAGHQWAEDDLHILRDQARPAVTFNRIGPFVDGVSGLEINNRQTTMYYPRTIGKAGINELLTGAVQWARDECDAEDEESEAVRDAIVCGYGCTQTRMDYDDDPDGMPVIERVDPLEIYTDPASRKPNFADARFVLRVKDIPVQEAERLYPEYPAVDLHARWAEDQPESERQPHNARLAPYYRIDQAGEIDRQRMQCRMVEVEWWDDVLAYRVLDPQTGRFVRMSTERARMYEQVAISRGMKPVMIKDKQKKYYKAICGNIVLDVMRGPDKGGFTYKFMTAKRDRNHGFWYGLVRAMRDPQMWANKFFSQMLHIVNTNAKGGVFAETDAFVDIEEARDSMAEADSITELNQGGLNKIKMKEPPAFPAQINNMMEMALDAIPATAGVNLEMIAQQTLEQAGTLEMQRKQQGMTVLAYIFNAKRRYQKEQGRLMLWMTMTFIADGRLVRIGGPEEAQYVPLIHGRGVAEYDVIVDEAPTSPNMKERVWAMVMQMFPMLKSLPPQALIPFIKYSPFPTGLNAELQKVMQQQAQQPPNPMMQSEVALNQARAMREKAAAQHSGAQAQRLLAETQLLPGQTQAETAERDARSRNLLAGALNQMQNAGLAPSQLHLDAMDRQLQAQDQAHDQMIDRATHNLAVYQAMNPPQPAQGAS